MFVLRFLPAVVLAASVTSAAELRTLTGKAVSGDLVRITDKELTIRTPSGKTVVPVSEVLAVELAKESALPAGTAYTLVECTDGSVFHCAKTAFKGKDMEAKLAGSDLLVKIPLATIANYLNEAQDAGLRQEWTEKHLARKGSQDVLAVRVAGVINGLEGTIAESATDKGELVFEYGPADNRKHRNIDPKRVLGIIFQRILSGEAPTPLCRILDRNQNVFMAGTAAVVKENIAIGTVGGATIELPMKDLVRLDFTNDKVVFLSDLKPLSLVEKSNLGWKDNLGLDKSLEKGVPLQLEGQIYSKGLAIHSHTEIVYALDGKYAKFEAIAGMDDGVGGDGKPVLKIEADGKELFAGTIQRKDKRRQLTLDVKGARQLRIVVSSSSWSNQSDHLDLANAKLSK